MIIHHCPRPEVRESGSPEVFCFSYAIKDLSCSV